MNITLTVPDDKVTRIATALCHEYNLPVTNANAKKVLIDFVKNTTIGYERKLKDTAVSDQVRVISQAKETEVATLIADVEGITIT